jgi:hypothetical protein
VTFPASRRPLIGHDRGRLYSLPARVGAAKTGVERGLEAMARAYTDLHEGMPPRYVRAVRLPPAPSRLTPIGRLSAVIYAKRTTEGAPLYRHPFKPHARPEVLRDEHGHPHFRGGRYTVNERGIVDMMPNPSPRGRRRRAATRAGFAYIANPTPAKSKPKAKANKHARAYEFASRLLKAGAAGALFEAVGDVLMNFTPLSQAARGSIQGTIGVLGGYALAQYADVDAGLGVALVGIADLVSGGLQTVQVQGLMNSIRADGGQTPPGSGLGLGRVRKNTFAPSLPAGLLGGAFVRKNSYAPSLPAGALPANFDVRTLQSCAGAAGRR